MMGISTREYSGINQTITNELQNMRVRNKDQAERKSDDLENRGKSGNSEKT